MFTTRNWDDLKSYLPENLLDISYPQVYSRRLDGNLIIDVAVPGFGKESLELKENPKGFILTGKISGNPKNPRNSYCRDFNVLLQVPHDFDKEAVQARMEHGVVTLVLPPKKNGSESATIIPIV